MRTVTLGSLLLVTLTLGSLGCGAANKPLRAPTMAALAVTAPSPPAALKANHFRRDGAGSISEADLQRVLAAPVFLEEQARIGVVQVSDRYETDRDLPLDPPPRVLAEALGSSGLFEVSTEVSTEWPADSGISGLRELAARYRAEYLLLYRHRFLDRARANAWAWTYLTVAGLFVAPARTLESAGVLEATLFDVKTGTILFTVFERVHGDRTANVWHNAHKRRALKQRLLGRAMDRLAERVVTQSRLLAAARPGAAPTQTTRHAQASTATPPERTPDAAGPRPL